VRNERSSGRHLAAVAAAQLACGLVGLVLAIRHRRPYDILWLHGRPDRVARDAVAMGTAMSAPAPMLVAQAVAVAMLLRRPARGPATALAVLGAAQVPGYLGERHVQRRLRRSGWDAVETPVVSGGVVLAAVMAVLGGRVAAARVTDGTPAASVNGS
jgi:hypothetical protein